LHVWQQELPELSCIEITAIAVMMSGFFVSGGQTGLCLFGRQTSVSQFYLSKLLVYHIKLIPAI
jgi:hypothetical protein